MFPPTDQSPRYRLFHRLQCMRQRTPLWLTEQQMHVLRHNHISGDLKAVLATHSFQRGLKQALRVGCRQKRLTPIAAEGHEVQITGLGGAPSSMRIVGWATGLGGAPSSMRIVGWATHYKRAPLSK